MSRISRHGPGDRHRLDSALVAAGQGADPVTRARIAAFDAILHQRRRGTNATGRSLRNEIEALTMPEVADPGIFASGRMTDILAHVAEKVLPTLDMPEDTHAITRALLEEEIASQRDIRSRLTKDEGGPA
ncbi:hypothetical protein [Falsirhodobacter halotolerans]|uniref:hypothetical protein n=1 Tax=Falsirhodobacter halotolerans TaxID=1146892 RepID=UPI001FD01744|nr:hypothetical protein [Falsirhodobacter halotolerans]MCJ8141077.1 hypothetical protein [Falsirhodobacter halotolerans]